MKLRIVTYNIHKCRGMDTRVRPDRIAAVLKSLDADAIALQEVVRGSGVAEGADQAGYLADKLNMDLAFGENRKIKNAPYGNAILSKHPIEDAMNYEITASWREKRGCLRADIKMKNGRLLRLFNAHMSTGFLERRKQANMMVSKQMLGNPEFEDSRILVGDFNEWTQGLTTKLLSTHMQAVDVRKYLKKRRTYPGVLPLLHLDHIYFDPFVELKHFHVVNTKEARIASDHLPMVADFEVKR